MDRATNPMADRVALGVTAAMLLLALLAGAVVVAVGTAMVTCGRALLIASPLTLGAALSKECGDARESMTADQLDRYLEERPECAHY